MKKPDDNYISLKTRELLQEFGAGDHIPGSGTAAALSALLACELNKTVIIVTKKVVKNWKRDYDIEPTEVSLKNLSDLKLINEEIVNEINPELEKAFQEDSEKFHEAFKARIARDREYKKKKKKNRLWVQLEIDHLNKLKVATEPLLVIAAKSTKLISLSIDVFDKCFTDVRGDAAVAINSSISAAFGALSVLYLNLRCFSGHEWAINTMRDADRLYQQLLKLDLKPPNQLEKLRLEAAEANAPFRLNLEELGINKNPNVRFSDKKIEEISYNLRKVIWNNRIHIWKDEIPDNVIEMIKPEIILELLDYSYQVDKTLGSYYSEGIEYDVAGVIDKTKMNVSISYWQEPEVQRFTTAHELGHAILHDEVVQHRDRSLSHSDTKNSDPLEVEANKFASSFLIPRDLLNNLFQKNFKTSQIENDSETIFSLNINYDDFTNKYDSLRKFSRLIASTSRFSSNYFEKSLAETFGVSVEAMAIRLENIGLVRFSK